MGKDDLLKRRNSVSASLLASVTEMNLAPRLKVTGVDGSKPIVIALGEETIGEVFTRISWSGGFANLFIVTGFDTGATAVSIASIMPPASSLHEREAEPLEIVSAESPIAMLVELAEHRAEMVSFNLSFSGATAKVESVEEASEFVAV